jgi:hypothetical protein
MAGPRVAALLCGLLLQACAWRTMQSMSLPETIGATLCGEPGE